MELGQLAIGAAIGILVGCFFIWLLDRRHQRTIKKLVESRKKIERQRTQAVHELFALQSGEKAEASAQNSGASAGGGERRPPSAIPSDSELMRQNAELQSEVASLRTLIARADGALTAARRKRDEHEQEIARLHNLINSGAAGNVINFQNAGADRMAGSAPPRSGSAGPNGGLAL